MGSAASNAAAPAPLTPQPKVLTLKDFEKAIEELLIEFRSQFKSQLTLPGELHCIAHRACDEIAEKVFDLSNHPDFSPSFSSSFPLLAKGTNNKDVMRISLDRWYFTMQPYWIKMRAAELEILKLQKELQELSSGKTTTSSS
jgi:hypothetical protein